MKKYFILFLIGSFSFSTLNLSSQSKKDTIWYDANWNPSSKNVAAYYRPEPIKKDNGYVLEDYYLSGKKQMVAFSLKPNEDHFQGNVTYYYENGNVWQEAEYKDGVLHGIRKRNYESGKVKNIRTNVNGKIHGEWTEYFETGQIKEIGHYLHDKRDGSWKEYHKNGKLKGEGKYANGKKVGVWKMYYYDGIEND